MKASGLLSSTVMQGSGTGPTGFVDNGDEEAEANVSPEEQQQYNMFVENGMRVLYTEDGQVQPEIIKRLSTGKKPIDALAQASVWLVMMLEQNAKQKGAALSDDVVMHGGRELMEQIADIGTQMGIHSYKQAELQGAWYNALDMYREANSDEGDRFNPNEAAAAFEQLNEADKEGRANEVVPGFYQQSEKAIAVAAQDQAPTQEEDEEGGDQKRLNPSSVGSVHG